MFLLDTDHLSVLTRPDPPRRFVERVERVPLGSRFTSSINLGELFFGAYRIRARRDRLLRAIRDLATSVDRVLPFETNAAARYGQLRAELELQGQPLADADLRIAAIALVHGLTVVTGNVRHFDRVPGLGIENWLQP